MKRYVIVKNPHKYHHVNHAQYQVHKNSYNKDMNFRHELEPLEVIIVVVHEVVEKTASHDNSLGKCKQSSDKRKEQSPFCLKHFSEQKHHPDHNQYPCCYLTHYKWIEHRYHDTFDWNLNRDHFCLVITLFSSIKLTLP